METWWGKPDARPGETELKREQTALIRGTAGGARGSCLWFICHRKSLRVKTLSLICRDFSFAFCLLCTSLLCFDSETALERFPCARRCGQIKVGTLPSPLGPACPALRCRLSGSAFRAFCVFQKLPEHDRACTVGVSWWLSGKESPCPRRGQGFDPWPGTIPRASGQLSPCAMTTEPVLQSPGITIAAALEP